MLLVSIDLLVTKEKLTNNVYICSQKGFFTHVLTEQFMSSSGKTSGGSIFSKISTLCVKYDFLKSVIV